MHGTKRGRAQDLLGSSSSSSDDSSSDSSDSSDSGGDVAAARAGTAAPGRSTTADDGGDSDPGVTILDDVEGGDLKINKRWASAYEARKRRQELGRARELGLLDEHGNVIEPESSSSSSESEDEGEALTRWKDAEIMKTIQMIRSRDPRVYDPATKFYASDDSEGGAAAAGGAAKGKGQGKRVTLKDVMRQQLVEAAEAGKEDAFSDDAADGGEVGMKDRKREASAKASTLAYDDEQRRLRAELAQALASSDGSGDSSDSSGDSGSDSGGGVLKRKPLTAAERATHDAALEKFLADEAARLANVKDDERKAMEEFIKTRPKDKDGQFLHKFMVQRKWEDASDLSDSGSSNDDNDAADKVPTVGVDDNDDVLAVEATDAFEAQYNFRFEEEEGAQIVGHARNLQGTVRRKEDKRKREREARRLKKLKEREEREQELRRLKNMKRAELKAKLAKVQTLAGRSMSVNDMLTSLDGDFDPEEHDRRMQEAFNDDYYADDEDVDPADIPHPDEEDAAAGSSGGDNGSGDDAVEPPAWVVGDAPRPTWAGAVDGADLDAAVEGHDEMLRLHAEGTAGGHRTRFNYRKVPASDYGLTAEEILTLDDKALNQLVSLRKLAPYRDREFHVPGHHRRKVLARVRAEQRQREAAAAAAAEAEAAARREKAAKKAAKKAKKAAKKEAEAEAEAAAVTSKKKRRRKKKGSKAGADAVEADGTGAGASAAGDGDGAGAGVSDAGAGAGAGAGASDAGAGVSHAGAGASHAGAGASVKKARRRKKDKRLVKLKSGATMSKARLASYGAL